MTKQDGFLTASRYQQGSIRRLKRKNGFTWEWRYYMTDDDGVRQPKAKTFPGKPFPAEKSVGLAIEPMLAELNKAPVPGEVVYTFGDALNRRLSELSSSTEKWLFRIFGDRIAFTRRRLCAASGIMTPR